MRKFNVAIVGATGAVGEEILEVMRDLNFPLNDLLLLASKNSAGNKIDYKGTDYIVQELTTSSFEENDIDIAFFSAGGSISEKFVPYAVDGGALVIDNTSHFRMDENVPLVVPEVNGNDIKKSQDCRIIANPNCSTIQMVLSLKPLHDLYGIKRVDVSTYQAVSGAGKEGMEELVTQMQDFFAFKLEDTKVEHFAHQIALNVIPQIDIPSTNDFTKEEMKMVNETQKILGTKIQIAATCVRVPVLRSHSESLSVTFGDDVDVNIDEIRESFSSFEGLKLVDNLKTNQYPMPKLATSTDITYVGRIRKDLYSSNIVHYFNVADQLRVGAATNSVKIALKYIELEDY
jgi:aspartate-semialdehyde dehydrogenase